MHSRTVHSSMPNTTADRVRLSLDLRYQSMACPTGRAAFPSFQVRSRDGRGGAAGWLETRERVADRELGRFNRWDAIAAVCA